MEHPVLELLDHHIRLYFPQSEIQIGGRAGSHIRLTREQYQDCQVLLKSGEKNGTWQVFLQSPPGIWLNDRFYLPQTEGISLKNGDVLQIGPERFQFQEGEVQIKTAPDATDEEFIRVATPRTWEVATESLRIVAPPRRPGFTWRKAVVKGLWLLVIALMSYWLMSGKFLLLRSYFTNKFPVASSPKEEFVPEPASPELRSGPGAITPSDPAIATTSEISLPPHKDISVQEQLAPHFFTCGGWSFSGPHLVLKLRWQNAGSVSLVWVDNEELATGQRRMFDYVREGKLSEAELLYTESIFPKLCSGIKSLENAVRYNGWAIGLLRMLQEWEKDRDPELRRRLERELKILEMQSYLCVTSPVSREFFQRLHSYIANRLKN